MNIFLAVIVAACLFVWHVISSFALFFVPRRFRRKKNISGKTVLITGAGSGLGRQLAIEFSKHSTCLILVDINRKSLLETESLLENRCPLFIYDCDVSDYKKVYEMAKEVKKDAGDVDILVNNAGIVSGQDLLNLPEEKIIKTMEVNALAHFWTCKAFLPAMVEKNDGHIVSIASIAGKMGGPRVSDYCASKFAAIGFAESLDMELFKQKLYGIKTTIVCPTIINTGLFAGARLTIGGVLRPEYAAQEIVAGVLENEELIFLPHYFKYLFMIKEFVPRWIMNKFFELSDNIQLMDNFTGRTQNEKIT